MHRLLSDPNYDPTADLFPVQGRLPPTKLPWEQPDHQPREPAAFPVLPDEERDSVMSQLLGSTMGGLQYAAETLDKPGRAVRGLLGGQPGELLNLIPFSDTMGLTDPKQSVSGRDLLENTGLLSANEEGLDFGDVAGFGVDVLTDPLTWWSGIGAFTKAGKEAAKLGKVARAAKPITTATEDLLKNVATHGITPEELKPMVAQIRAATGDLGEHLPGSINRIPFDPLNPIEGQYWGKGVGRPGKIDLVEGADDALSTLAHELQHSKQDALGMFDGVVGSSSMSRRQYQASPLEVGARQIQDQVEQAAGKAAQVASVPMMITEKMRNQLLAIGKTAEEISNMTPQQAWDFLKADAKNWGGGSDVGVDKIMRQVSDASGKLGPTLSHQIDQGQASLTGFHVPFTDLAINIGTGPKSVEFAGKYIDPVTDYLKYGNPIGRTIGGMLETGRYEMGTQKGQRLAAEQAAPKLGQKMFEEVLPLQKQIADMHAAGLMDEAHVNAMREGGELGLKDPAVMAKYNGPGNETLRQAAQVGMDLRDKIFKVMPEAARQLGIKSENLTDNVIDYLARYHHPEEWSGVMTKIFDGGFKAAEMMDSGRLQFLKNIKGGSVMVNDLVNSPETWGTFEDAVKYVEGFVVPNVKRDDAWKTLTPTEQAAKLADATADAAKKQATEFVTWVQSLDPQKYMTKTLDDGTLKEGAKFFNGDPLTDAVVRTQRHLKQMNHAEFTHDLIGQSAVRVPDAAERAALIQQGYVPVKDVLKGAKLTYNRPIRVGDDAAAQFAGLGGKPGDIIGFEGAKATTAQKLGLNPIDVVQKRVKVRGRTMTITDINGMDEFLMAPDVAKDAMRFVQAAQPKSEALQSALGVYDKMINIWRDTASRIWPGFHARNLLGGVYYNAASGATTGIGPYLEALAIRSGKKVDTALEAELHASGVWRRGSNAFGEQLGTTAAQTAVGTAAPVGGNLVGAVKDSLQEAGQAIKEAPGMYAKGLTAAGQVSKLGGQVGNFTEDVLRIAHYIGMKSQGYAPQEAASSVFKWLFDYSDLTAIEREGFRRAMPFYKFAKENLKLVADQLLNKPGGALGQTIRAINAPRQDGGFVPDYVSEGVAIPLPSDVPGGRYLTNLGLPIESAFDMFASGPTFKRSVERNLQGVLGMTSPLIKGVATAAFGVDPFTGRDLNELYKFPTQSTMANLVANTVAGTPLSKARTVLDDRKGLGVKALNLLTGAHITDLSGGPEKARQMAARKIDVEMMKESPHLKGFTRYYVPPEQKANLTPEEISYLRLQETLAREARAVKKQPGNHLPKG
jgi:hypothetical protein